MIFPFLFSFVLITYKRILLYFKGISAIKQHQIWYEISVDKVIIENNKDLSKLLIKCLNAHYKRQIYQSLAQKIDENMYITRNWFQKKTPISAYHLILLMREYDFIRDMVDEMIKNPPE